MAAPPAVPDPAALGGPRPGGLGWLAGGVAAVATAMVAAVVAVLFAAALAIMAVLAFALALLAWAAWRVRGSHGASPVISARWTGYGWDARGG